jgi:hypothetical protein
MNYQRYYRKLFKKLKINLSVIDQYDLIDSNKEFYEKHQEYIKSIKSDVKISENNIEQKGGSLKKIKYVFKNHEFKIYEDTKDQSYNIHIDNDLDKGTCLALLVGDGFVYIESISSDSKCASPGLGRTKGGSLSLKLSLDFILNYLCKKYEIKYIQLKDNSFLFCEHSKEKIKFDNFYMFTHGETWYGSYGFVPFNPIRNVQDINKTIDYQINKRLLEIIKVGCTKLNKYLIESTYKHELNQFLTKDMIDKILENYHDRSLLDFFKDFMYSDPKNCALFNDIYKNLTFDLRMTDLHGSSYYLPLNDSSIARIKKRIERD